jgi:hypothetical protein
MWRLPKASRILSVSQNSGITTGRPPESGMSLRWHSEQRKPALSHARRVPQAQKRMIFPAFIAALPNSNENAILSANSLARGHDTNARRYARDA